MNLIDKRQLDRGILEDVQNQIDALSLLSGSEGGVLSGNLTINADLITSGAFNSVSGLIFDEDASRVGVNLEPTSNLHLFNSTGDSIAVIESNAGSVFLNLLENRLGVEATIGVSTGIDVFSGQVQDSLFLNSTTKTSFEVSGDAVAEVSPSRLSFYEKAELSGQSIIDGKLFELSSEPTIFDSVDKTGYLSAYYGFAAHGISGSKMGELWASWNPHFPVIITGLQYNGSTGSSVDISFNLEFSGSYLNVLASGGATGIEMTYAKYTPKSPEPSFLWFEGADNTYVDLGTGMNDIYTGDFSVSLFVNTYHTGIRQDIIGNNYINGTGLGAGETGIGWNLGINESGKLSIRLCDGVTNTDFEVDTPLKRNRSYNVIWGKEQGLSELWLSYYESSASSSSRSSSSSNSSSSNSSTSSDSSVSSSRSSVSSSRSSVSSSNSSSVSSSSRSSYSSSISSSRSSSRSSSSSISSSGSSESSASSGTICELYYITNPSLKGGGAYMRHLTPSSFNFYGTPASLAYTRDADWVVLFVGGDWVLFDWTSYGGTPPVYLTKISQPDLESGSWTETGSFFGAYNNPVATCICTSVAVSAATSGANGGYTLDASPSTYGAEFAYTSPVSDWVVTYAGGEWQLYDYVTYPLGYPRYYNINSSLDPSVGTWEDDPDGQWPSNPTPTVVFWGC